MLRIKSTFQKSVVVGLQDGWPDGRAPGRPGQHLGLHQDTQAGSGQV